MQLPVPLSKSISSSTSTSTSIAISISTSPASTDKTNCLRVVYIFRITIAHPGHIESSPSVPAKKAKKSEASWLTFPGSLVAPAEPELRA
ncbi:hypothetical protein KR038_008387 [Drosophila bunnanda]|nr:hypothetical protein KR038_008387 [Drosophila bunnanda]